MRSTLACWKAKSLAQMFRKLKLAGAHPDVLWGIDAQKAQHNGEEMIRLETLMHERANKALGTTAASSGSRDNSPQSFLFWLQQQQQQQRQAAARAHAAQAPALRAIECTLTPYSESRVVKQQLTELFTAAGIFEDFELGSEGVEMNLESVLRHADAKQTEHLVQSGSLYIRGDKAVENLRRFGVLLVVEEDGMSYLVTLPETHGPQPTGAGQYSSSVGGSGGATPYMPAKAIIGPNGEVDEDVRDFMAERGMRAFDLRMGGGHASVERFVVAFERLERMYAVHRGRAFRPSVCIVMSLRALDNFVAPDGSLVLSVQRMASWEEFMLGLPQEVWKDCVQKHQEWRIGAAPKLQERKRQLLRVADMFNFYRVTTESPIAGRTQWQEDLIARLLSEETMIRRAVLKYNLKSDLLKKRGELRIVEHLYSALPGSAMAAGEAGRKEIGFRVGGDGRILLNYSTMNTGQMLRVLKDNLKHAEAFQRRFDNAVTALELVSRHIPVDFSIDTEWKHRVENGLVNAIERFVQTMKQNEAQLGSFLNSIMASSGGGGGGKAVMPANMSVKKRMVWVVSDRFDTMPSGVVFIPHDVDFDSIKRLLLSRR